MSARLKERLVGLAPWAALAGAGAGWFLHHQVVSDALHFGCHPQAIGLDLAWGAVAVGLVVAGAIVSVRTLPARDAASAEAALRRFIVHLGLMATGLATLAIVLGVAAGFLLPGCPP